MSDTNLNMILIACGSFLILKDSERKKKKKIPTIRVNPYLAQRNEKGRFVMDFEDMVNMESHFKENFHMDYSSFMELFKMVEPHLMPKRNSRPDAISPKLKLAITLEYFASGSLMRHLASVYRVSKQHIGPIIQSVCDAICIVLREYVPDLKKEDFVNIINGFEKKWQFPNCLGAMDGKHIALKAPPNCGSIFYNYKGFHSIVLFAVADHNYRFTYFDIGAYGSEGDANIFSNSDFGRDVMADRIQFPESKDIAGNKVPCFFIGDDAFPLSKRIIKPYTGKNKLSEEETIFNYRLSRARRCVENAFGILSTKWFCLKREMLCSPDRAQKIVTACCLLHNFLIEKSKFYYCQSLVDSIDFDGNIIEGTFRSELENVPQSIIHSNLSGTKGRQCDVGKAVRDKLKMFVNSPEGSVPWQRQAVFLK